MKKQTLVLFDIDGTLLKTPGAGRRAMTRAYSEVFGVENPFEGYSFQGKTDQGIFAETTKFWLHREPDAREMAEACRTYLEYLEEELQRCHNGIQVMPGIPQVLTELKQRGAGLGLATGNLREGARMKLSALGLWEFFSFGGFGCDAAHRGELTRMGIDRGRQRYGSDIPDPRVFIIGDSPLDIQAAHYNGVPCIAVLTGWSPREELEAHTPHAILPDLADHQVLLQVLGMNGL